jgi:hypothetical protein
MAYEGLTIQTIVRLHANFGAGDIVRFIGTDTHLTVRRYDKATREYQVQRGDDDGSLQRVLGVYLELVKPARAIG